MARISLILEYVVSTIRIRLIPQVELQGKNLLILGDKSNAVRVQKLYFMTKWE